jgi:hypothetical protein
MGVGSTPGHCIASVTKVKFDNNKGANELHVEAIRFLHTNHCVSVVGVAQKLTFKAGYHSKREEQSSKLGDTRQ